MSDSCQNCHDPNGGVAVSSKTKEDDIRVLWDYYVCFKCMHMSVYKNTYKIHRDEVGWWLWDNNPIQGKHEWKRASIDEEKEFPQAYKLWISKVITQEET